MSGRRQPNAAAVSAIIPSSGKKRSYDGDNNTSNSTSNSTINKLAAEKDNYNHQEVLTRTLSLVDPLLQFLTKATGQTAVPLLTLARTLPGGAGTTSPGTGEGAAAEGRNCYPHLLEYLGQLAQRGILQLTPASSYNQNTINITTCLQIGTWQAPLMIGFPSPPGSSENEDGVPKNTINLHGSTKTAAKRRSAALRKSFKADKTSTTTTTTYVESPSNKTITNTPSSIVSPEAQATNSTRRGDTPSSLINNKVKEWSRETEPPQLDDASDYLEQEQPILEEQEQLARQAMDLCFQFSANSFSGKQQAGSNNKEDDDNTSKDKDPTPCCILPQQLSYAGTHAAQVSQHAVLDNKSIIVNEIPTMLFDAFSLDYPGAAAGDADVGAQSTDDDDDGNSQQPLQKRRQLYTHQVAAIESALRGVHTLVCTGTGSGKSLGFLLPVLSAAFSHNQTSLILFPTKALAQDQLVKLTALLESHPTLAAKIRPATLDGDTPHSMRSVIAENCNVILTNPDTLHAAILPHWKRIYKPLLQKLHYVVVDEAHMYDGVFGAHVAMVLARLARVSALAISSASSGATSGGAIAASNSRPTFLACSATMAHPEHHFRLLLPISIFAKVTIVLEDGSPRSAKHFFVWNPPILDTQHGKSIGRVTTVLKKKTEATKSDGECSAATVGYSNPKSIASLADPVEWLNNAADKNASGNSVAPSTKMHRRHSADETALLLARAVAQGVRCIAFCKTRSLVEWVYERAIAALKANPQTLHLVDKVESYRGGYSRMARRHIEERLFQNKLLGVVGTSALELGVDIGGLDLTLHCGFPSSHASLLQQAGRAGRGGVRMDVPSLAIVVCFNSPPDQHLWRHPKSLLTRGFSAPLSMPIYPGLVQGHLLCAGEEFPLCGELTVTTIQQAAPAYGEDDKPHQQILADQELFGSLHVYNESMETLISNGSIIKESVAVSCSRQDNATIYKTHPSIQKPWLRVSLRSIEPLSYDIVDLSHPGQGGKMDGIHHNEAIMDTIPYSRVFYHAFPGAIIMHRGRRFKIVSLTRPPAIGGQVGGGGYRGSMTLVAYAKPSSQQYFTRPLSGLTITPVKQMERVDHEQPRLQSQSNEVARAPHPSHIEENTENAFLGSFAGCGIVTVRRHVHGYKKLSLVTGEEISRSELSLPDMEWDTFAIWIAVPQELTLGSILGNDYGPGVHALSHALLAVAPLFVPCASSDIECDHSAHHPTRITLFDSRAGGSGICAQLWKAMFQPNGLLEAAIDLLDKCPSCSSGDPSSGYAGGCPACLQSGHCPVFNDFLSKSSGLAIAKLLLKLLKQTDFFKENTTTLANKEVALTDVSMTTASPTASPSRKKVARKSESGVDVTWSPRRKARALAMQKAKDLPAARDRQIVVGRPSWPMDQSEGPFSTRQETE
jgi:DEAD/DEAH box helicase domain-containing protein